MWVRWFLICCFLCVGTFGHTNPPNTQEIIHNSYQSHSNKESYRTEDILLLFKSCYETIYFLGNTKYKRSKRELQEKEVSKQCFCICDKIRSMYKPSEFLDRPPIDIHNIIKPLTAECNLEFVHNEEK